ncbi:minor capsid protein [Peptoniphilus asaccharolyticus]
MAKNKNTEYWEKRALELEKVKDTRVRATQKDLHKINLDVSKRMKRNIHYWVSRFSRDNELTHAEAMRKLSPEEIKEFRMDVDEYVREASKITDETPDEWLLKIANASTTYHFTRLEMLKIQLINSVNELISKENDLVFNFLEDLYKDIYFRNTYDIAKGIGAELNLFTPNEYAVKTIVKNPWTKDGLEFSERLWGPHRDKLVKELDKSLKDSIVGGENAIRMSERLAETMGARKNHAEALLHTESARIAEEARFDNYKDLGVEKYIIVATLDHKTSSICRNMDGKVFLVKDKKVGVNYPPFHVRCRTTTAPYDLDEHSIGERAARDKNGKTIYVPKDMTYKEFYKKYIEADEDYSAVEKAWKNRYSDKKLHEKYRKIYGKDIPKSFEDFQKLKYNDVNKWESLKAEKIDRIKALDYNEKLDRTFSDLEVRVWYDHKDKGIGALIDTSKPIKEQAIQACNLRNMYRTQAREMMKNQIKRRNLDVTDPNKTFEELLERKKLKYGLEGEEAYKAIVASSMKANPKVNKMFGLE